MFINPIIAPPIMAEEVDVRSSHFGRADFARQARISTTGLERCVAVVIFAESENIGLIAHRC